MLNGRVLVVDDLPDQRATYSGLLEDEGWEVYSAGSRNEALGLMQVYHFHVAVLDVRLDETDEGNREGLLLMHEIKQLSPKTTVIILTGYADVEMVQEALERDQDGTSLAYRFLEKQQSVHLPEIVKEAFEQPINLKAQELRKLIAIGETETIEFKSSLRWTYPNGPVNKRLNETIARTLAGFLNNNGGCLLLGVADDGAILGIEHDLKMLSKDNTDGYHLLLTDVIKTYLGVDKSDLIHVEFIPVDNKTVCKVTVDKSPQPVYFNYKNQVKFLVRTGNSTRELNVSQAVNYIQRTFPRK